MSNTQVTEAPAAKVQGLKLVLDLGPLVTFFVANSQLGLFPATALFMVATLASLVISRWQFGRIPLLPLVTGAFIILFGGMTLLLNDEIYIKLKPTFVNLLFGTILLAGLAAGWMVVKLLMGEFIKFDDAGWRKLQFRWGVFFLFLALVNEIVWRNFSTDFWVTFKLFGVAPLSIAFLMVQFAVLKRHMQSDPV